MKLYLYCDKDEHPLAEATTKLELARKMGLHRDSVYRGFKRHYKPYVEIELDDEDEDS